MLAQYLNVVITPHVDPGALYVPFALASNRPEHLNVHLAAPRNMDAYARSQVLMDGQPALGETAGEGESSGPLTFPALLHAENQCVFVTKLSTGLYLL